MKRRHIIAHGLAVSTAGLIGMSIFTRKSNAAPAETFEIELSEAQWRAKLTPAQFSVLREHGTERAGSSALNNEKRAGKFHCAGCDLPVFDASTKFESGTGWPSFYQPLADGIRTREDRGFFMVRTEVHCRRCGGHLGHVFEDGPKPTGLRYCMNGVAMTFVADP